MRGKLPDLLLCGPVCRAPCVNSGFYRDLQGFTGFYRDLYGFVGVYRVFNWVLQGFIEFYRGL